MSFNWHNFDWPLLVSAFLLISLGLSNIASATFDNGISAEFLRQVFCFAVGIGVFVFFTFTDIKIFFRNGNWLYVAILVLLVSVIICGVTVNGAKRWVDVPMLGRFQPSEVAKLLLVLCMSRYLSGSEDGRCRHDKLSFASFCKLCLLLGFPALLIMAQPDLGTAIVFAGVGGAMMWSAGYDWRWFAGLLCLGAAILPHVLHDYQRQRIMVFLNPEADPMGAGWNIIQAKIAIGSGGLWGKGWMEGTQNRLNFVPEHHTDFIFTVIGEEMGLVGALCLILLLVCLVMRSWQLAEKSVSAYDSFLAFGIGTLFFVHAVGNLGMTSGILPVVGIPLPFVSYGGTSLIINMAALGLLNNIYRRMPSMEFSRSQS
ncbi:MAG: rod shape-determining protein RodA [Candidatus Bruticola sp.]